MSDKPGNFIYSFFILFLSILLSMLLMFTVMVHYDRAARGEEESSSVSGQGRDAPEGKGGGLADLTPLYRANLFAIDLCLIVLAEATLILLFVRYTIPAALIATVALFFVAANSAQRLRSELIPEIVSRFVTNRYATLTHTDLMLLILLSGLIMAFLVSVLLKQGGVRLGDESSQESPSPPPSPRSTISPPAG